MGLLRILALILGLGGIVYFEPQWISDKNVFLKDFLDNDLLSVLGFISAVTLASVANLHLQINQLEDETGKGFRAARKGLKLSAYSLIIIFGIAFLTLIAKPIVPQNDYWLASINATAVCIVYINIEILWDISAAVFSIPARRTIKSETRQGGEGTPPEQ